MADLVGHRFGRYRLVHLLGKGNQAEVYLGEDPELRRQVALKVLLVRLGPSEQETLLRELQRLANLVHPHLVPIREVGIERHTPFLVLDYVPGGTLRYRHPPGTRLSPSLVVAYVQQVAAALEVIHEAQLVHGALRPQNLLLGRSQEVLVSDVGLAIVMESLLPRSLRALAGAAAYLAPEQWTGSPLPASDQYALGVMIYEWLSGACPFLGSVAQLAEQHHLAAPPPLAERVGSISPAVEQVVQRALAKPPGARFASASALAQALQAAFHGRPNDSSTSQAAPAGPTFRRAGLLWLAREPMESVPEPTSTSEPPTGGTDASLAEHLPAARGRAGLLWLARERSSPREEVPAPSSTSASETPLLLPGIRGRWPRFTRTDTKSSSVRTALPGTRVWLHRGHVQGVTVVAWSPNGRWLASGSQDQTVQVWEPHPRGHRHTYRGHHGGILSLAWSPNGRWLASGSQDRTLHLWEAESGQQRSTWGTFPASVTGIAWSPDGSRLAAAGSKLVVIDVATDTSLEMKYTHVGSVTLVAWSPDGSRLALAGREPILTIWHVATGEQLMRCGGHAPPLTALAWSPDGDRLVSGDASGTIRVWRIKTGKRLLTYRPRPRLVGPMMRQPLAWSPDGRALASASMSSATVYVWRPDSRWARFPWNRDLLSYMGHAGLAAVTSLAWSPDGTQLASASMDETVQIWQAP